MRVLRVLLVAAGAGLLGYGGWLLLHQLRWTPEYLISLGLWFGAGPVLHELLVGPVVALLGLLVARALPRPWRTTIAAGMVATGVLLLVGIPVMTRPAAGPPNPGLHDRAHLPGLLAFLAAMWGVLLAATVLHVARDQRRGHF